MHVKDKLGVQSLNCRQGDLKKPMISNGKICALVMKLDQRT